MGPSLAISVGAGVWALQAERRLTFCTFWVVPSKWGSDKPVPAGDPVLSPPSKCAAPLCPPRPEVSAHHCLPIKIHERSPHFAQSSQALSLGSAPAWLEGPCRAAGQRSAAQPHSSPLGMPSSLSKQSLPLGDACTESPCARGALGTSLGLTWFSEASL